MLHVDRIFPGQHVTHEWKSDDGQGEQRVSATGPVKKCNGPQGRSKHKQHNVPHGKDVEEGYGDQIYEGSVS